MQQGYRCGTHRRHVSRFLGEDTNNVAELMAVIVALEALKDPLSCDVTVTTDSQHVVGGDDAWLEGQGQRRVGSQGHGVGG